MYIPEHFRARSHAETIAFMRANPFAILISSTENGPYATHLPLFVRSQKETIFLRGHVAKANPHWRYLEQQPECLTIFHGAHSYISPSNYRARESVPTWNYAAVHLYGKARIFSSPEDLLGMLHELVQTFEPAYAEQWASLGKKYRENMLRQIVGFEIAVERTEGKFKLSQNRPREDQAKVIAALQSSDDTAVSGISRLMRERGLGLSEKKRESD